MLLSLQGIGDWGLGIGDWGNEEKEIVRGAPKTKEEIIENIEIEKVGEETDDDIPEEEKLEE